MDKKVITLSEEKEPILIPLYLKAMETLRKSPILSESKALEIVEKINYDFKSLKIPGKTITMMCLRAKIVDTFLISVLNNDQDSVVLHLGCGLDSRYVRVNNHDTDWYDLDYSCLRDKVNRSAGRRNGNSPASGPLAFIESCEKIETD